MLFSTRSRLKQVVAFSACQVATDLRTSLTLILDRSGQAGPCFNSARRDLTQGSVDLGRNLGSETTTLQDVKLFVQCVQRSTQEYPTFGEDVFKITFVAAHVSWKQTGTALRICYNFLASLVVCAGLLLVADYVKRAGFGQRICS